MENIFFVEGKEQDRIQQKIEFEQKQRNLRRRLLRLACMNNGTILGSRIQNSNGSNYKILNAARVLIGPNILTPGYN